MANLWPDNEPGGDNMVAGVPCPVFNIEFVSKGIAQ